MSAGFAIAQDTLTPILHRLAGKLTTEQQAGFVLAWGRGVALQAQRNALAKGGRRFWRALARSVNVRQVSPAGVEVASDHVAAAQKQFGGPIEAPGKGPGSHNAKFLTIPIPGSSAEGRMAGEFGNLFVLGKQDDPNGRGGVLARAGAGGEVEPLFILVRRTKPQRPDPWFPDEKATLVIGERLAEKKLASL